MSIDLSHINADKKLELNVSALLQKKIILRKKQLSLKKKESLYSSLSILISSGLDIKSSFQVIIEESKKETKLFYTSIYERLLQGVSLSESLLKTEKISLYEYHTLKIGEETGNLFIVLDQLSNHFTQRIKQKRQLVNAFSYPALVIATAIVVVLFMMNFIVPMFEELFKRFNGNLPQITQVVINISNFLSNNLSYIFSFILAITLLILLTRKTVYFRIISSKLILSIPLLNAIIKKMYMAKYCQTFALLNSSRIPIVTSIQLIQKIIGFYPYEKALETIEEDLVNGKLLYETYQQFSLFDSKLISLTKVGEEVNKLSDIYKNLSKQYSEEIEYKVSILNSTLEPILIIFIGLFVALILISMYLPMFQMSNSMF